MHPYGFMSTGMSIIGDRLKEERKRLGLSQAQLAEKIGIHRNTQNRYESGGREPDASYLNLIRGIGIDVEYVMTGVGEDEADLYEQTVVRLVFSLCSELGIDHAHTDKLIADAFAIEKSTVQLVHGHQEAKTRVRGLVQGLLSERGSPVEVVDISILAAVLEGIEVVLGGLSLSLAPAKKALAVAMLYRSFKASGKVDQAMIEEAVRLAAS